ncbi:hypothetical protein [Schleiferilactobacillus shenzhenensis]|nr:hypothetical protein [Schleiferilactobacillus shenzhenensis]
MGFFAYDGIFNKIMGPVFDVMVGSLFWLVCAIPLVTIGNATNALIVFMHADKKTPQVFFRAFITDFWRHMQFWLSYFGVSVLLAVNIWFSQRAITAPLLAVGLITFYWTIWILFSAVFILLLSKPALADLGFKNGFLAALYLAARHLGKSLLASLVAAAAVFILYLAPIAILVIPATVAVCWQKLFQQVTLPA